MDPNATYEDLLSALLAQEYDEATEMARALWNWCTRGGFIPDKRPINPRWIPDAHEAPGLAAFVGGINIYLRKRSATLAAGGAR